MTPTIHQMPSAFSIPQTSVLSVEKKKQTNIEFIKKEFGVGGLVSDLGNAFKLANAWTEWAVGHATESSQKITDAGYMVKNLTGILEAPRTIEAAVHDCSKMGKTGTITSVMNFLASFFVATKSLYEGVELAAARFSLLPMKVLSGIKPLNPAGTFSYAFREVVSKQIPDLRENWGTKESYSTLLKMGKSVALAVVGAFSLIAIFFQPICANYVYPVLLTVSLTCSVSCKFFDQLMLSEHSRKLQDKGVLV
jgi:hypothetical protein